MNIRVEFVDGLENLEEGHIEELIERIMGHAEMAGEELKKNKNPFNDGLAQAYSEICDIIGSWAELNDVKINAP